MRLILRGSVTLSVVAGAVWTVWTGLAAAQAPLTATTAVERFATRSGGLELHRPTRSGAFFDVAGRRSAIFGYENREWEAWVYPLKVVDDFKLSFRLEGYPLDIDGRSIMTEISVRPEATTLTYAHAAFTVHQIMVAPLDEPGLLVLLEVNSVLPLTITASFRPRLRLMWPATSMTASIGWNAGRHVYTVTEETKRYAAVIGCPLGRDISVMPYQEEPRDVPNQLVIEAPPGVVRTEFIPIAIAASTRGLAAAQSTYDKMLGSARSLYQETAEHYERLDRDTLRLDTPDATLNAAFRWAKVGIDKGIATNPLLGTGLVAGFRTSGDSERPGFAWFFGRDSLWTTLAIDAYGDFAATRTALEFLRKFQRDDGKIPHEISQSASLVPWFDGYPYAWASADATPLYVVAHADYWRATGDREFIKTAWPSVLKAYRFSAATDTDGNALIENTNVGHGWVEGGALYPPHEEVYLQGLWVAASRGIAELADVMSESAVATDARAAADRTRAALENTYWLADRRYYAFATALPRTTPASAEPGPNREARQARLDRLATARLIDEDTVLPAVPLWFEVLETERAQSEIDHLGSAALATDWGHRILSNASALYDPLSYHYGSVWPLFTGWAAAGAYRYGRPHVGHQALVANASLIQHGALGYVTELLSGDFATPFGRSSHHQVWSEAMVVAPLVRGLLGIETTDGGETLAVRPQLPANWDVVTAENVPVGAARYNLRIERSLNRETISLTNGSSVSQGMKRLVVAPAFPSDTRVRSVTVNGRPIRHQLTTIGDIQRATVTLEPSSSAKFVFTVDEGTDVYAGPEPLSSGARNSGLRVIRARADGGRLHVVVEGRGDRSYVLHVRTPRRLGRVEGAVVRTAAAGVQDLEISFSGKPEEYVRRELNVPLLEASLPGR
jgi:glycogen debranching enzyme